MIKPKKDLEGNDIIPIPKCKNCNREKGSHKAHTFNCPATRSQFTYYFDNQFYEPKIKKQRGII
jgi:hypothetical protein